MTRSLPLSDALLARAIKGVLLTVTAEMAS
jgi:hypothetical protein